MKKLVSLLLIALMAFTLIGCGSEPEPVAENEGEATENTERVTFKAGMVCIHDENSAYDRNFYMAADNAKAILAEEGIDVEWIYTYNHEAGDPVAVDCQDLADEGCQLVILNSYGQEPAMLTVAADYPETTFVACTNYTSQADDLENTVNAMPSIHEGRYLAGIAAGCKLQQMIDEGVITPEEAVMGYVGAFTYAEVLSGYTAFYLGAKSVCPSVTMLAEFIGSWGDPPIEAQTAQDLIDRGAIMISQHSDATTPASTAEANKDKNVFHIAYNIDMTDVAPNSSLISSRIDWTNYFVYAIRTLVNGGKVDQDYKGHGLKDGDVVMTDLNTAIAAPGTAEKIAEAKAKIESGELKVFDTSTFTLMEGQELTSSMIDITGDFVPEQEAIKDGEFLEGYYVSAPQFAERIAGITLVNESY